ncbi:pilin [Candidatus Parcubacteria bacterium]|nr:pilin [Candidatus Parcubacteria bacterium]
MKKFIPASILTSLAVAPSLTFAQTYFGNVGGILSSIGTLVNRALPIVVGIALLGFFWGLARFVFAAGDPERQKEARQIMIWGVVALFVMTAVWGLVRFLADAIPGVNPGENTPVIPTVPQR